jgi:hypothetical protein
MRQKKHIVDVLFMVLLFCVFAILVLFVIALGARAYQTNINVAERNFNMRISTFYIAEKIRQNDAGMPLLLSSVGDSAAIVLQKEIDDAFYETWIFVYEDQLREAFVQQGMSVSPTSGQAIMALKELNFEQREEGLLYISVRDMEDNKSELYVTPHGSILEDGH